MAWELRKSETLKYYYRVARRDGGVVRTYLGRGDAAARAAEEDARNRAARAADREEAARLQKALEPLDELSSELDAVTATMTTAVLSGLGLREHRGCWRRSRAARNGDEQRP